jgi:hypothetical protein
MHSISFTQEGYITFGVNYSWMNKITASTSSSQIFSPGFMINYGRDFLLNERIKYYVNGGINWLSGGVTWKDPNFDIRVKSNYNNLRFDIETGLSFSLFKAGRFEVGLNNSFGVKLKSEFNLSEQQTIRNWAPLIISKLIYKKNEVAKWAFAIKVGLGFRTIHFIQAINSDLNLRYESSSNYAGIEIRRYLR